MSLPRRAAWLALAALLMPAGPARADDALDPRVRLALTTVSEGLEATISLPGLAHLAPMLNVRNTTGKRLTILDDTGAPFLRTQNGVVEGNVRSAFLGPAIAPNAPASPSPGGPEPQWKKIGTGDALRWYDVRAAYDGHGPGDETAPSTLKRFTIPALLGDESATIDGAITWKPILGRVVAAFESFTPPDPKISVRVVAGTLPAIQLTNGSGRTIEITGRDDKPFARIGPAGITVNVNSPTYRDTRTQPEAAPGAEPDWQPQNAAVLVWLERRAAFDGDPPADIVARKRPATIARWTVPGTIDGAPFSIRGVTRWIPSELAGGATRARFPWIPAAAGLIAAAAVIWIVRRRRA